MTRDQLWLLKEKYNGEITNEFKSDCERIESGEPLAYIIGHIPFLDTTIYLDSHPLIPRVETEYWCKEAIKEIQNEKEDSEELHILDLCAGSGCIGVALLKEFKKARVDFGEIDKKHHETILKNIRENISDTERSTVYTGDLFENISSTYDYILSNPPYIDPHLDRTTFSVRNFEPSIALYGGKDGAHLLKEILHNAPTRLKSGGSLYLEHEPEHVSALEELGVASGFSINTRIDQYGIPRYTRFTRTLG